MGAELNTLANCYLESQELKEVDHVPLSLFFDFYSKCLQLIRTYKNPIPINNCFQVKIFLMDIFIFNSTQTCDI